MEKMIEQYGIWIAAAVGVLVLLVAKSNASATPVSATGARLSTNPSAPGTNLALAMQSIVAAQNLTGLYSNTVGQPTLMGPPLLSGLGTYGLISVPDQIAGTSTSDLSSYDASSYDASTGDVLIGGES